MQDNTNFVGEKRWTAHVITQKNRMEECSHSKDERVVLNVGGIKACIYFCPSRNEDKQL